MRLARPFFFALLLASGVAGAAVPQVTVDTLARLDAGTGGISVAADGTVYVADFGARLGDRTAMGRRVWAVTPGGAVSQLADGFEGASGNEIVDGVLYQSNIGGGYVTRLSPSGERDRFVTEGLASPVGIASDDDGTLYVANCGNNTIQKVTRAGVSSRFAEGDLLQCPNGIARADDGNYYVANFYNGDVIKVAPDGTLSRLATLPGENNGHLIYHRGELLVVARGAHQIYRVSLTGEVEFLAGSGEKGGADGLAAEASFCFPNDIGASPDGTILYVNDVADETSDGLGLAPSRLRRIVLPD